MLTGLILENFRCYEQRKFELAPTTVIIGPNGVGKTNIVEAISMLSLTTSWRTEKDNEVVRWDQPFTRVVGGDQELIIQVHPYFKRLKVDGVSKRTHQVIGRLPTVLFQPDDIHLLYGSPADRRHYLDRILSQTSSVYTQAIIEVQHVLRQRNKLLKDIAEGEASESELFFWDQELAKYHTIIQEKRQDLINDINRLLPTIFLQMVPQGPSVRVEYQYSPRHSEEPFLAYVSRQRAKEIAAGASLYGPHREDITFFWGEHPVHQSMSRGQGRSLLVACKVVELDYISQRSETKPILLLDDIFSELDEERRERLFGVLGDYQVVMTTTEYPESKKIHKDALIISP